MNEPIEFASLEFTADVAGAIEETRVSAAVIKEVVRGVVKVVTELAK
jgi:hypothetical protein